MTKRSAKERDDICIGRVRRRVLRAYKRLGTVRAVGAVLGVNHGWVSALIQHGSVPKGAELRARSPFQGRCRCGAVTRGNLSRAILADEEMVRQREELSPSI